MSLLLALACTQAPTPPKSTAPPPGTVITTPETLAARVPLPAAITAVAYRLDVMGTPGSAAIGPTDYALSAWVALSSDEEVEALYGPSMKVAESPQLSFDQALLLPLALRPEPKDGVLRLNGAVRPGGGGGSMVVDQVVQIHGQGVFITAHTR